VGGYRTKPYGSSSGVKQKQVGRLKLNKKKGKEEKCYGGGIPWQFF